MTDEKQINETGTVEDTTQDYIEKEAVKLKNKVELLEELAEEVFISMDLLIHKLKLWLQADESYLKDFIKIYALMTIDNTIIRLIN